MQTVAITPDPDYLDDAQPPQTTPRSPLPTTHHPLRARLPRGTPKAPGRRTASHSLIFMPMTWQTAGSGAVRCSSETPAGEELSVGPGAVRCSWVTPAAAGEELSVGPGAVRCSWVTPAAGEELSKGRPPLLSLMRNYSLPEAFPPSNTSPGGQGELRTFPSRCITTKLLTGQRVGVADKAGERSRPVLLLRSHPATTYPVEMQRPGTSLFGNGWHCIDTGSPCAAQPAREKEHVSEYSHTIMSARGQQRATDWLRTKSLRTAATSSWKQQQQQQHAIESSRTGVPVVCQHQVPEAFHSAMPEGVEPQITKPLRSAMRPMLAWVKHRAGNISRTMTETGEHLHASDQCQMPQINDQCL